MSSKKPHRNLIAWQKSIDLVVEIYEITKKFPREESLVLTSQIRRAAISVSSNIAEGAADRTKRQFANYLSNAIGSLNEIDTQFEIALRLGYIAPTDFERFHTLLDECIALTYGLRKTVSRKQRAVNGEQKTKNRKR